jgi:hypothetical protein
MKMKYLVPLMVACITADLLVVSVVAAEKRQWDATITVLDETGQPMANAEVEMSWYVRRPDNSTGYSKADALTDTNGVCRIAHEANGSIALTFTAKKTGYYATTIGYPLAQLSDGNPNKWKQNVTLVLKPVKHPIPMYVNRVDIGHRKKPAYDKPVGFDLTVGDLVAPYGKGGTTHMLFTWHLDKDKDIPLGEERAGWESKLKISFPNAGDGIQEFDVAEDRKSELRSAQESPLEGYLPELIKIQSWHHDRAATNNFDHIHKNYYVRVQTVLDEKGNIKSARYGKIYGDFEEAILTYLNPTANSRDLEFDLKNNLSPSGLSTWSRP